MEPDETPREPRKTYSAQDVRQGEIILRHRWSRIIFFGALAGIVLVAVLVRLSPWI